MLRTISEAASFLFWIHWTMSLLTGHLFFSGFGLCLQALSVWRLWTPCLFRTDCIRTDCLGCPAWRLEWHSSPHLPPYLLKNKAQILPEVNKKLLHLVNAPESGHTNDRLILGVIILCKVSITYYKGHAILVFTESL